MKGTDCLAVLKALSEPTRMRIVRLLLKRSLGVNDISERLGVSQYNTSKHLRILRESGLLQTENKANFACMALPPPWPPASRRTKTCSNSTAAPSALTSCPNNDTRPGKLRDSKID